MDLKRHAKGGQAGGFKAMRTNKGGFKAMMQPQIGKSPHRYSLLRQAPTQPGLSAATHSLSQPRPCSSHAVAPSLVLRPERTAPARQTMPDLLRRTCFLRAAEKSGGAISYRMKNSRWRPVFALETGGSPSSDGEDFEEDSGFLGRTRLGRLVQAAGKQLLEKLNSARSNSPTKIFLVLLGFYTANALATILGQTGDWDVLVAGVVVAAIEGIGMLMYRKPVTKPPGRFQSLIAMVNFWKAGVCLGLFVDAFKLGS